MKSIKNLLSVVSGKGGVGKTFFSTNLGVALGLQGKRVLIVDADLHHPNVHIAFGLPAFPSIVQALRNNGAVSATQSSHGVDVLAGGQGGVQLPERIYSRLPELLQRLSERYDYVILDHGAGIDDAFFGAVLPVLSRIQVVSDTKTTSMTDAYKQARFALLEQPSLAVDVVLNRCRSATVAVACMKQFRQAAARGPGETLRFLGWVPSSKRQEESVRGVELLQLHLPRDKADEEIIAIARRVVEQTDREHKRYVAREEKQVRVLSSQQASVCLAVLINLSVSGACLRSAPVPSKDTTITIGELGSLPELEATVRWVNHARGEYGVAFSGELSESDVDDACGLLWACGRHSHIVRRSEVGSQGTGCGGWRPL